MKTTLRPEIKAEWLKRLRSGDYPQGRSNLNKNGRFCCLGVLCEIATEQGVVKRIAPTRYAHDAFSYKEPGSSAVHDVWTPSAVVKWALTDDSLDRDTPEDYPWRTNHLVSGVQVSLGGLNDDLDVMGTHRFDFNAIADQIEKDY